MAAMLPDEFMVPPPEYRRDRTQFGRGVLDQPALAWTCRRRYLRRSLDAASAAVFKSSEMISITDCIAEDITRRGLPTQAIERVSAGRRRWARIVPASSAARRAMPGRIVAMFVEAIMPQMAGSVSISSRGDSAKPALAAVSSSIRRRP